jgi:hypothetical protein
MYFFVKLLIFVYIANSFAALAIKFSNNGRSGLLQTFRPLYTGTTHLPIFCALCK